MDTLFHLQPVMILVLLPIAIPVDGKHTTYAHTLTPHTPSHMHPHTHSSHTPSHMHSHTHSSHILTHSSHTTSYICTHTLTQAPMWAHQCWYSEHLTGRSLVGQLHTSYLLHVWPLCWGCQSICWSTTPQG